MEVWMLFLPWKSEFVLAMEAWKLFLSWSESVFFHGSLNVDVAGIILRHYVSTQDVHLYTTFSLCRCCNRLSIVCVSYSALSGVIVNGVMYVNPQRPYLVYTNIDMWTITLIRTTVKYSYRCDRYNTSKWVSLECRGCLRWFNRTAFGTLRDILAFVV